MVNRRGETEKQQKSLLRPLERILQLSGLWAMFLDADEGKKIAQRYGVEEESIGW